MTETKGDIAPAAAQTEAPALWFSTAEIKANRIVLTAAQPIPAGSTLRAFVNGISIASVSIAGRLGARSNLKAGSTVELACEHYPACPLPAEIRFAVDEGDADIAPPIQLTRPDQILTLVGPGRLEDVSVTLVDGILRGRAVNPVNALLQPHLICRVNGTMMRNVTIDSMTPRPGKGAMILFSVPTEKTDFSSNGVNYEILSLPDLGRVARLALAAPLPGDGMSERLGKLEAELAQISRRQSMETETARAALARQGAEQKELLNGFAEYMLALIYDRLNTGAARADTAESDLDDALVAFRDMLTPPKGKSATPQASVVHLTPEMLQRHGGWYAPEKTEAGDSFCWMSSLADFRNPYPETPVSLISIALLGQISPDVFPITVLFDGQATTVETLRDPQGNPVRLNITPVTGAAKPVHHVQLLAARPLSPRTLGIGEDDRLLSVAMGEASVHYEMPIKV